MDNLLLSSYRIRQNWNFTCTKSVKWRGNTRRKRNLRDGIHQRIPIIIISKNIQNTYNNIRKRTFT